MTQNFQVLVQEASNESSSNQQTILLGGVLIAFNVFVMLFVGLYWMNPVMHEFISGKPLL
tara:strand:- start:1850 stop:2029 length:180 start_codon:yes stop_codon:yes gene_type:complete